MKPAQEGKVTALLFPYFSPQLRVMEVWLSHFKHPGKSYSSLEYNTVRRFPFQPLKRQDPMKDSEVLTFPRYVGMGVHRQKRSLGFLVSPLFLYSRTAPAATEEDGFHLLSL